MSYLQADQRSDQLASGLQALGLQTGDSVCVMMDNCIEAIDTWFGLLKAGLVEVPVNVSFRGQLLLHIIGQSRAKVLVCGEAQLPVVLPVLASNPGVKHLVVAGQAPSSTSELVTHRLADLYLDAPPREVRTSSSDPTVVMYTSGTTGPSKGVVGTHTWQMGISDSIRTVMDYSGNDTLYSMFPIYYVNARYAALFPALSVGANFILDTKFSASRFWDICLERDVTAFNYLGAVIPMLWKQPPREDDRDNPVRIAFGAACPTDVWKPFESRFGLNLVEAFGLTEIGLATCNTPEASKVGSCGKPLGNYEIELHDENGQQVPEGTAGEAVLRPTRPGVLFKGYFDMPTETLHAFRDLWFHTGDRLRKDEDGFYHFVDRVKDSMRRRGMNVSSWEVEQAVNAHDDVLESAAYGVTSNLAEDEIMIAVVAQAGRSIDPAELLDHCRREMAEFSVPRYVRIVDALPKTPSQRIEKYKLREAGVTLDTFDDKSALQEMAR